MTRLIPMPGGIIAEDFFQHPKVVGRSDAAIAAWAKGLSWVYRKRSNGRISERAAKKLGMSEAGIAELVEARLWDVHPDGGWVYHNYLKRNHPASKRDAAEASGKARAQKSRESKKAEVGTTTPDSSDERTELAPQPSKAELRGLGIVVDIRPRLRLTTAAPETIGEEWFAALVPGVKLDFASWRDKYAAIGSRPAEERQKVAENWRATTYIQECPTGFGPDHAVRFWHDFAARPRNIGIKPPVPARNFNPARSSGPAEFSHTEAEEWPEAK